MIDLLNDAILYVFDVEFKGSISISRALVSAIRLIIACALVSRGVMIQFIVFCEEKSMPNITLLVSPSCGACPSAKSLWKELRVKYSFSYREIDITTTDGQDLANRHSVRAVPATIIDGRLTFVGVPSRQSAEKALQLKMKPQPT